MELFIRAIKADLFVQAYMWANCNGVRAMQKLGHKGSPAVLAELASRMLRKVEVQETFGRIRHEACIDTLESIYRMTEMARADLSDFLDSRGRVDLKKGRRLGKLHLIRKLKEREIVHQGKDGAEPWTEFIREIELYDAQAANKILMQYQGLLNSAIPKFKDERELDALLHEQILRVHGKERGLEISKALGLKVVPRVH